MTIKQHYTPHNKSRALIVFAALIFCFGLASPLAAQSKPVPFGFDAEPGYSGIAAVTLSRDSLADEGGPLILSLAGTRLGDKLGGNLVMSAQAEPMVQGIYAGVDLHMSRNSAGDQTLLLSVTPGFDPRVIVFQFDRSACLWLNGEGDLMVETPTSLRKLPAPSAMQFTSDGSRTSSVAYEFLGDGKVSLKTGDYDPYLPLRLAVPIPETRVFIRN